MAFSLKDLLMRMAKDGVKAAQDTKVENVSFFEALFDVVDGRHVPKNFVIKFLTRDVKMPITNMTEQDIFAMTELDLELETDIALSVGDEGELDLDCTLKNNLLKRNSTLKIGMRLRRQEPTEGMEQIRSHLADRLADDLQEAKNERKGED